MSNEIEDLVHRFEETLKVFPEVRYAGDPVLRQPTEDVSIEEGIEIGTKLGDILLRYWKVVGYGRGFAAPQAGINKSVFVARLEDNQIEIFINPKVITWSERTNWYRELCLSSGIMSVDVERPEWIDMEWFGIKGIKQVKRFDGFKARLFGHEIDHTKGILNLDKAQHGGIEFATFDPLKEQLRQTRS